MSDLPEPMVPAEVDLHGFSGFLLDVDRLLASELVALGKPEECWAAVMLWCRAWKQSPPGSLPNDARILAAFSGAGPRWPKVRDVALRGFVLCSDGRLYHRVLADEANAAWQKRKVYRADQERLKKWRENKRRNGVETADETGNETRFNGVSCGVSEPEDSTGTGTKERKKLASHPDSEAPREPRRRPPKSAVLTLNADGPAWLAAGGGRATVGGWDVETAARLVAEAAGINAYRQAFDWTPVIAWLDAGRELHDDILPTIRRIAARSNYQPVESLGYFTRAVMGEGVPA